MHRTEGDNNISNLFTDGPPGTIVDAAWLNSIQEEIAGVVEGAGLQLKTQNEDDGVYGQLLSAINILTNSSYDRVINSLTDFADVVERVAANQYKIKNEYTSLFFRKISGDIVVSTMLSGGDTWGYLETNNCILLEMEQGAYFSCGDSRFYIEVNTDHTYLKNVYVKGTGSSAASIQRSFLLSADYVVFDNCRASDRLSDVSMCGFEESSTSSNNETSLFRNCKTYNLTGDNNVGYRNGFSFCYNLDKCFDDGELIVPRVEWTSSIDIFTHTPIGSATYPAVTKLNSTDIAWADPGNGDLRVYRFNGISFSSVGGVGLAIAGMAQVGLTALNSTDVAFVDAGNDDLRTYRFDTGTSTWSQVGNDLNIAGLSHPSITALNSTDIALCDENLNDLKLYRFDGTDWAQVGSGLTIAGVGTIDMCKLNGTDIAFIDGANDDLRVYRFDEDSGTWSQIGNDYNITPNIGAPAITCLNSTDVAFFDGTNGKLQFYRFDGTDWSLIGNYLTISGTSYPTMTALTDTDIAFYDATIEDLVLYRANFYPR